VGMDHLLSMEKVLSDIILDNVVQNKPKFNLVLSPLMFLVCHLFSFERLVSL